MSAASRPSTPERTASGAAPAAVLRKSRESATTSEVFFAADRPYGLIEAAVIRDDAPGPGRAWQAVPGFA